MVGSHHQLRPREDRVQRGSQLVRDHRDEVVFHAARALGLGPGRALGLEQPVALGDGGLPLGDVAGNLRDADDRARVVEDGRDRQRDIEVASVFGEAFGLEVIDTLAATNTREDLVLLCLSLRRDEDPHVLADQLGSRVPEQPLGCAVDRLDDAVQILRDDRVVGRVDDRRQICLCLGRAPAIRDVDARSDITVELPSGA